MRGTQHVFSEFEKISSYQLYIYYKYIHIYKYIYISILIEISFRPNNPLCLKLSFCHLSLQDNFRKNFQKDL